VARIMHDGQTDIFSTGSYEDLITEVDGELLFKERVVVTDSTSTDALLVIPLWGASDELATRSESGRGGGGRGAAGDGGQEPAGPGQERRPGVLHRQRLHPRVCAAVGRHRGRRLHRMPLAFGPLRRGHR